MIDILCKVGNERTDLIPGEARCCVTALPNEDGAEPNVSETTIGFGRDFETARAVRCPFVSVLSQQERTIMAKRCHIHDRTSIHLDCSNSSRVELFTF